MRTALPLVLALSATALSADIAPDEVWHGVRSVFDGAGYDVRAQTHLEGSALVVSPLVLTTSSDNAEDHALVIDLSGMRFAPFGSGGVRMSFPQTIPIQSRTTDAGRITELELTSRYEGLVIDVTGSAEQSAYAFSADSIRIALDEMRVEGELVPKEDAELDLRFSGISGTAHTATQDGIRFDKTVKIASADYIATLNETDGVEAYSVNGAISDIVLSLNVVLPGGFTDLGLDSVVARVAGVEKGLALNFGKNRMALTFRNHKSRGGLSATSAQGAFSADRRAARLAYDVLSRDLEMTLYAPNVPAPLTFGYRELVHSTAMPGRGADELQLMDVKFGVRDLLLGDSLWAFFDPDALIPRDPIAAVLDFSMMVLFSETFFVDGTEGMDIQSLTVHELEMKGAGMAISGTGDFTYDPVNTLATEYMPPSDGVFDVRVAGLNGFLDNLLELRLIEQEDAMPVRMFLAMLARAVEGEEDTFVSQVEFENGELVSANGQRLK